MTETLNLKIIWRGRQIGPVLRVLGDPTDAQWMHDHLVNAIKREDDADLSHVGEYVMEIRPVGDDNRVYCTFATTSETRP